MSTLTVGFGPPVFFGGGLAEAGRVRDRWTAGAGDGVVVELLEGAVDGGEVVALGATEGDFATPAGDGLTTTRTGEGDLHARTWYAGAASPTTAR